MELTSKQRAQLRGLANTIDTIIHIGKDGIGENLVKQTDDALEARELIKGRVIASKTGELSVFATEWAIAAKALQPLPALHKDLNEDTRTRKPYIGMIADEKIRNMVRNRSKAVASLRKTFAQLTAEEKNAISHRGSALRAFAAELKTYLEKQ